MRFFLCISNKLSFLKVLAQAVQLTGMELRCGNISFPQVANTGSTLQCSVFWCVGSCGKRLVADVAAKILVPMRLTMSSHIFAGYQFTTNLAQTFHLGSSKDTIELIRIKYH